MTDKRALLLAGGGMRVAWQAGVLAALEEAGIDDFAHADGTSGGIFNLAALLSGVSSRDLVERWSTLDVHEFVSFLPLHEYLGSPTNLKAAGDADGIVGGVLPHLGVDLERIRSAIGMSGTFNVANFTTKTAVAIPHDEIDLPRLVAGVSLPIFLPAVEADGQIWTDAVWMRDANPIEAVRRGCNELWLLWCIGNTGRWANGPLEQYVHMIELSANSALFEDLDRIVAEPHPPVRLHVVKPQYPLPLDPDYYLGRITSDILVDMGYRDAWNYLDSYSTNGVPLDFRCTQMIDPPLGVRLRSEYHAHLTGDHPLAGDIQIVLGTEIHDIEAFIVNPTGAGLVGHIVHLHGVHSNSVHSNGVHPHTERSLLRNGSFHIETVSNDRTRFVSRATTGPVNAPIFVEIVGEWHDDPGFDFWNDVTNADMTLRAGDHNGTVVASGVAKLGINGFRKALASIEPSGAHDLSDRAHIITKAARFLFGKLAFSGN